MTTIDVIGNDFFPVERLDIGSVIFFLLFTWLRYIKKFVTYAYVHERPGVLILTVSNDQKLINSSVIH